MSGTPSLKALAALVLERDRARDSTRDTSIAQGPELSRQSPATMPRRGTLPDASEVARLERLAIQSEPPLPPAGTPERTRLEARHRALVAGLLKCARHGGS